VTVSPGTRREDGDTTYAAMELLDGETLREWLTSGALPACKALSTPRARQALDLQLREGERGATAAGRGRRTRRLH